MTMGKGFEVQRRKISLFLIFSRSVPFDLRWVSSHCSKYHLRWKDTTKFFNFFFYFFSAVWDSECCMCATMNFMRDEEWRLVGILKINTTRRRAEKTKSKPKKWASGHQTRSLTYSRPLFADYLPELRRNEIFQSVSFFRPQSIENSNSISTSLLLSSRSSHSLCAVAVCCAARWEVERAIFVSLPSSLSSQPSINAVGWWCYQQMFVLEVSGTIGY